VLPLRQGAAKNIGKNAERNSPPTRFEKAYGGRGQMRRMEAATNDVCNFVTGRKDGHPLCLTAQWSV